jgi:predicted dehydrogenase
MDYTKQPLLFRVRKAFRYVRLYGLQRTRVKVRSHYHMKRRYPDLPRRRARRNDRRTVAVIGCGKFAFAQIAYYLRKNFGDVIYGAMDVDIERAASLFETYRLAAYTDDAEALLSDPAIDTVFIASNHATHADYAIRALALGKTTHIEKPHVVNETQLRQLCRAMSESDAPVALGFNRPLSRIGVEIARRLEIEDGPMMLNWFVAGHELPPDHWYFREEEGGRILGNLCHWTDFIYRLIPEDRRYPIVINPTRAAKADADVAVTYTFGDGSIAAITFSAKGHTFEGVKERFAAHRGNTLVMMDDFRTLEVDRVERRTSIKHRHRDHGHEAMIRRSYLLGRGEGEGVSIDYVWETGELFLKTREALAREERIVLEPFDPERVFATLAAQQGAGRRE